MLTTVLDIYNVLDLIAPFYLTMNFDNTGILVGDRDQPVSKVLLSLDCAPALEQAIAAGAQLIITHHPLMFHPIKHLHKGSIVYQLAQAGISLISAHTNLDIAQGGINDILAETLRLTQIEGLEEVAKIHDEKVYLGRVGQLDRSYSPAKFAKHVKALLGCDAVKYTTVNRHIRRVAVCCGSGGSCLDVAISKNADALVTGDVQHDQFIDAAQAGICLIDAGHFYTEDIVLQPLRDCLAKKFPHVEFLVSHISCTASV